MLTHFNFPWNMFLHKKMTSLFTFTVLRSNIYSILLVESVLGVYGYLASYCDSIHNVFSVRCRKLSRLNSAFGNIRAQVSNVGIGSGGYEGGKDNNNQKLFVNGLPSGSSSDR